MEITVDDKRDQISVTVRPGGMLNAGEPPKIAGYEPFFVAHYGLDRTTWTYRKAMSVLGLADPMKTQVIRP